MHSLGILHEDLKSGNLIFRSKNNQNDIVFGDFRLVTFFNFTGNYLHRRFGTLC